jgi:hypothetical protein
LRNFYGLTDVEAPPTEGSERVETGSEKNIYKGLEWRETESGYYIYFLSGLWNGVPQGDWNSPAEQRERPKGVRLIASLFYSRTPKKMMNKKKRCGKATFKVIPFSHKKKVWQSHI